VKKQQGWNCRDGPHSADSMQLEEKTPLFEAGMQMLIMAKFLPVSSKKRNMIFACKQHPHE